MKWGWMINMYMKKETYNAVMKEQNKTVEKLKKELREAEIINRAKNGTKN